MKFSPVGARNSSTAEAIPAEKANSVKNIPKTNNRFMFMPPMFGQSGMNDPQPLSKKNQVNGCREPWSIQ